MTLPLGRLESRPLREAWANEATAFTPWLADNLDALARVVGVPLEFEQREVPVEEFYADIIARRTDDEDSRVLIENQLERADHRHLGQILTYLAGLDVRTVIWIAEDFRAAHRSAIKWLNENTGDRFSFFAVRVRAVRIGNSPLAPMFEVVERPNLFERKLHVAAPKSGEMGRFGQMRRAFWTAYLDRHPQDAALGVEISGSSSMWLSHAPDPVVVVSIYVAQNGVGAFIRGRRGARPDDTVAVLQPVAAVIESELGVQQRPDGDGYHFGTWRAFAAGERTAWPDAIDWLHGEAMRYLAVLRAVFPAGS